MSFLVGDFLVAPDRNELRQLDEATGRPGGEPIRLTSKQMDVLVTLAAKAGQPVSKNELFEAVWPGVTVGEDNISSCIYELRKAFGSDYIRTVRNRGYLLAARVERDLPPGLLEALEPPRTESAENLLAGLAAAVEPPLAEPDPPPAAPPPPPVRSLPPALDRQTRRKLLVAFGLLVLVVLLGLLKLRQLGTFTVAVAEMKNNTGDRALDDTAKVFRESFLLAVGETEIEPYFRMRKISLFAGTRVDTTITPRSDGTYLFTATFSGDQAGLPTSIKLIASKDTLASTSKQLIDRILRAFDTHVCRMEIPDSVQKANHCYEAGRRQIKSRAYEEANDLLLRGADIYSSRLPTSERQEAAQGLLKIRDQLANSFDVQGFQDAATEQIRLALELAASPGTGIDAKSMDLLKIRRREAQIRDDIPGQEQLLIEIQSLNSQDPDLRHSLGWFKLTHHRDCGYALYQFTEAIQNPEEDAHVSATYLAYIGDTHLVCGDPNKAIEAYDRLVQTLPEEADPLDSRAKAYILVGKYDEASADLSKALSLDETLYTAQIQKGNLARELGYFRDAAIEYQLVLDRFEKIPNFRREVLMEKGRLALLAGQPELAEEIAAQAVELKGGNRVEALWLRGISSLALGEVKEARVALEVLEERFAGTKSKYLREYLHHLRAQMLLADHRGVEALRELDAALANYPADRLFFLTAKAEALEKLGRRPEALAVYDELLAINDHHLRSICAAADLSKTVAPQRTADLYGRARDILELEQSPAEDSVRRTCLDSAVRFLDGGSP